MEITGSNIMIVGSIILIPIAVYTPREHLLSVAIPFIIIEGIIAFYFVFRSHRRRTTALNCDLKKLKLL